MAAVLLSPEGGALSSAGSQQGPEAHDSHREGGPPSTRPETLQPRQHLGQVSDPRDLRDNPCLPFQVWDNLFCSSRQPMCWARTL